MRISACPPGYLASLATELEIPGTGMVTCLYGAEPGNTLFPPRLEGPAASTLSFPPKCSWQAPCKGYASALGATMALRAATLSSVGGFPAVREMIGDDYHLGAKVAAKGLGVRLSALPVSTHLSHDATWKQSWRRQLRWSRTIRKQRPVGHFLPRMHLCCPVVRAGAANATKRSMAARSSGGQPAASGGLLGRQLGPCEIRSTLTVACACS